MEKMYMDPDLGPMTEAEYNWTQGLKHNFYRPPRPVPCSILAPTAFEAQFQQLVFSQSLWFHRHWWYAFPISALYLVLIFGGRRLMENRKPYELRRPLIIWNWSLAIFSILGSFRAAYFTWGEFKNLSFSEALCYVSHADDSCRVVVIWPVLFCWSKVLELGDTLFVVLRKRPLIFLHWYHHVTVLLYVWYEAGQGPAVAVYFGTINIMVHAFMYSYYALRAQGYWIPKWVSICLTLMQISQMFVGLYLNYHAFQFKKIIPDCRHHFMDFVACGLMYGSYCVLFIWFFYKAYLTDEKQKLKERTLRGTKSSATATPEKKVH